MSNLEEFMYQGKVKRILNLLLFSLAGISLSFVSIYLLAQFHFRGNNQLSGDLSEPEITTGRNGVPEETFHFHDPWVIVPDEDNTDSIDLWQEDDADTSAPETGFRWPELIPQPDQEENHDSDVIVRPSER